MKITGGLRKTIRQAWFGIIILTMGASCSPSRPGGSQVADDAAVARAASENQPIAPGKFIPTFTLLYEGPKREETLKEAARFDLIDAGSHAVSDGNSWPALKQLNPHLKVFTYEMGPGEYNAWLKFNLNEGWDWIAANHGMGSADRWTAIGTRGGYLQSGKERLITIGDAAWQQSWFGRIFNSFVLEGKERLMLIGNPAWQQYWLEGMYSRFWSSDAPNRGADGVFSDNTDYEWPSEDGWYREGFPKEADVPADYYHDGVYQPEIWKKQAQAFLARAVTWLGDRHRLIIPNFGYMAKDPKSWHDLDSQPYPVFAAMEEGAFATPWGVKGQFTFYSEKEWLHQVDAMRHLKHIRALMLVHCPIVSPKSDIARMNYTDVGGANRGWDVLWFGLTSFLQGYDDVRQNAYLGFTVWGYGSAFWLDEFDPAHLNLGHALGGSHRVGASVGHCYVREFEAGWVVVNPTENLVQGVHVPKGQARVLDHYTFENSEAQPLVTRFDLQAHRGVVLLKPGRHVGDIDQASAGSSKAP
jgi:hypothetical protein